MNNFIIKYKNKNKGINKILIILLILFIVIIVSVILFGGSYYLLFQEKQVNISGCKLFRAKNYNPKATIDDGSCIFTREDTCNGNGEPEELNPYCTCDDGYGGRNCKKSMENEYKNVTIKSESVFIDGVEYIVNNFSLSFNDEKKLLSNIITINDLELENIFINPEKNNYPPTSDETENNIINNSYFSIGYFEPEFIEEPNWPNLNKFIWFRVNLFAPKNVPIQLFQLTLKADTNKGNIVYEYGDSTLNDYLKFNFNIENGKLILI